MQDGAPIQLEKALELCREYCNEHGVRTFSQCWGCLRFSKGDTAKMCFAGEGNMAASPSMVCSISWLEGSGGFPRSR